jgi:D-beta-D-heptose 7-phosphate kinase / D-beta-D-heptose 1-phosphate adenosyltransferase
MTVAPASPARPASPHVVVIGDALLDRDLDGRVERVCPEGPVPVVDGPVVQSRPGGAGLAAVLAASDGCPVTLITALGEDEPGRELCSLLAQAHVAVADLGLGGGSTCEKVRVRARGQTIVRLDHGGGGTPGRLTAGARAAMGTAAAVLVSDYGQGVAAEETVRAALQALPAHVPVIWDPHPRGPKPIPGVLLATPNGREAAAFAPHIEGDAHAATVARGRALAEQWQAANACVTLEARGVVLVSGPAPPLAVPARAVQGGDVSGAGDRFASRVTTLLARGALVSEAVAAAVEPATAFVEAGGAVAALAPWPVLGRDRDQRFSRESATALAARVRAGGGTVVATGGCFDLLHAGHVRMLEAARSLGDCLIVCLNSDRSVGHLKGDGRPVVGERDRAAVLCALGCVDGLIVFDDDTPEHVLEQLRPDLWAKGGDYAVHELPEAGVLERWGGEAVILPYVQGHSTTRLIEEVTELVR